MNRIEMRMELHPCKAADGIGREFEGVISVLVDGEPLALGEHLAWDFLALLASAREPGGYYIQNCGCGEPQCGGIRTPVGVRHVGGRITWRWRTPYSVPTWNIPHDGEQVREFDAGQYRDQADALREVFRQEGSARPEVVRLACYPGDLLDRVLAMADAGSPGYGGREDLPA